MALLYRNDSYYRSDVTYDGTTELQVSRPTGDISTNDWAVIPLYPKINKITKSDDPYITSPTGLGKACEVLLSPLSVPFSKEDHTVRYRYKKSGLYSHPLYLTTELYCGDTLVARDFKENVSSNEFVSSSFALTPTEANLITDYSDLRLRFIVGDNSLMKNLVSYWAFEDNEYDSYGKNHFTTLYWDSFPSVGGKVNKSLDAGAGMSTTPNFKISSGDLTLSFWWRMDSAPVSDNTIIGKLGNSNNYLYIDFVVDDSAVRFRGKLAGTSMDIGGFEWEGSNIWKLLTLRVNSPTGSQVSGMARFMVNNLLWEQTGYFLGSYQDSSDCFFLNFNGEQGLFYDEIGLWDRALTDSEILKLYNNGSGRAYPLKLY